MLKGITDPILSILKDYEHDPAKNEKKAVLLTPQGGYFLYGNRFCSIAEVNSIICSTEKLDFPLFTPFEKKQMILQSERQKIDSNIESLITGAGIEYENIRESLRDFWNEADQSARSEFGDLSENAMLNGFYLQEVIHRYAELQVGAVLKNLHAE